MKNSILCSILLFSVTAYGSGEYESMQWGLKNTGVPIELKLTDIDRLSLPAMAGEDVNLGSVPEVEGRKIRVAVIDSGIDLLHPEFQGRIYQNPEECRAFEQYQTCLLQTKESEEQTKACHDQWAKTDSDKNGYPMDCHGWNVAAPIDAFTGVQGNNNVSDLVGHGTHISGIIAALKDKLGISGMMRNVEILPVKVSGSNEEVQEDNTTDIFAKGILYALVQKVDIINLSVGWSSSEDSLLVSELIKKAHEMGVLVVVAGGNSAHSTETYPCSYNEVICVGSHNPDGSRSHFSNFGSSIDIFAPGHSILSTWPLELRPKLFTARHGFEFKNGTSFSAPHVVGLLARLLNLGFSPEEARVKLLGGARNGHADFLGAVKFKASSFIYPFKKSAAFLNWHEGERKVVLKLKNYLQDASGITLKLLPKSAGFTIKDDSKRFESWAKDEVKEVTFFVEGDEDAPSEMNFDLQIESSAENKSYPIQAVATTVIHDRFKRADTQRIQVQSNRDLEGFDFTPIANFSAGGEGDLLISQIVDGKLVIGALKQMDGSYRISRLHPTIFDKALIIQAAKVDLDLDQKFEYVITGMYQNKDKKWVAKFYVFDENFRESTLKICPENEHINLLTSMGNELHWMKKNGRMVPTWIATGYAPTLDLPAFNPWVARVENAFKKRIYYLDDKGLRALAMPSVIWSDFSPIKFFNQSKADLINGSLQFLYTLDQGFVKTFSLANTQDLTPVGDFILPTYQNIYPLDGMGHPSSQDLIYSETDSTSGAGRLSVLNPGNLTADQLEYDHADRLDPIQLLLARTPGGKYFAHTKYSLLYLDGQSKVKTESHNADSQIQYKRLQTTEGLYLSSKHTPGLSSELVQVSQGKLLRPAKYRFLLGNGCQEIGYHFSVGENQDQILFYCDKSKSILKVRL